MELKVYVPADVQAEKLLGIKPGSGIVGSPVRSTGHGAADRVRIDYEGGLYGGDQFAVFEQRLVHAADRHLWNGGRGYPTVARQVVVADLLRPVGTFDTDLGGYLEVSDTEALAEWVERWRPGR